MITDPVLIVKCDGEGCKTEIRVPYQHTNWGMSANNAIAQLGWLVVTRDLKVEHFCSDACRGKHA